MGARRLEGPQGPPDHPVHLCSPGQEGSQPKGEQPETAQEEGQVFMCSRLDQCVVPAEGKGMAGSQEGTRGLEGSEGVLICLWQK